MYRWQVECRVQLDCAWCLIEGRIDASVQIKYRGKLKFEYIIGLQSCIRRLYCYTHRRVRSASSMMVSTAIVTHCGSWVAQGSKGQACWQQQAEPPREAEAGLVAGSQKACSAQDGSPIQACGDAAAMVNASSGTWSTLAPISAAADSQMRRMRHRRATVGRGRRCRVIEVCKRSQSNDRQAVLNAH